LLEELANESGLRFKEWMTKTIKLKKRDQRKIQLYTNSFRRQLDFGPALLKLENWHFKDLIKNDYLSQLLNHNSLKKYVENGLNVASSLGSKDALVLFGKTGSGKSTTINYILQNPIKSQTFKKYSKIQKTIINLEV